MRLALFLVLALFAPSAFAGPAIAAAAAWVVANYSIVQIVLTVALTVYGSAQQRRAARRASQEAKRAYNDSLQDRTITAVSSEAPFTYIYGEAKVGSLVTAMFAAGDKDQYKYLVCVHAAHECESIGEIYINGKALGALDVDGNVTGGPYAIITTNRSSGNAFGGEAHFVTSGVPFSLNHNIAPESVLSLTYQTQTGTQPYSSFITTSFVPFTIVGNIVTPIGFTGQVFANYQWRDVAPRVTVKKHLGAPGALVDSYLQAAVGAAAWPSTSVLEGFCYTVIRLDLNQPEFQSGIPTIEPVIKGKKLFDPRTGLTVWSDNNSLATIDYLTSEICNINYADLPIASYITAANVCDEALALGKRYTINGSVTSDTDQKQFLQSLADSMAGTIVSTTWDIAAGKYVAPVQTLDQSDIVGNIAVNPGTSNADKFNGVRGKFISPGNFYVATDFTPYQNATYVAADGDEFWSDINYPLTDKVQRIWNLTRIETEDSRNSFTIKADFSLKVWSRKIGDRVTFTSPFLGQTAKIFRITDREYQPNSFITLTIKEDAPSIWDEADAVTTESTPNTNFSNPFLIDTLKNITLESGTNALLIQSDGTIISRIHVTWDSAFSQAVFTNGYIDIEWYLLNSSIPHKMQVAGSDTDAYLSPVEDGQYYEVRIRAVNPYLNVKSDWTYAPLHLVIGKTTPPSSILNFTIDGTTASWNDVFDADLDGYRFKYQYGSNTDWNSATLLYNGLIKENPYDFKTLPFGVVTIMAKAVDTSGNESLITANIFTNLGDPIVDNIVIVYALDPTFPGAYSGCSVVGGDLVATALDSFYGTDSQSFYGPVSADSFYEPGAFAQMVYTTGDIPLYTTLAGSKLTLDITTQGPDVTIEYRISGPGTFYGTDADSFYGATSGDPFYDSVPGDWVPWPGQITATAEVYQLRVTIGAGPVQGKIFTMALVADVPDLIESVQDIVVGLTPTVIPYLQPFTNIVAVQATLQANSSGAVTVETDKTDPLHPTILAYNNAHIPVAGAKVDITLQGY